MLFLALLTYFLEARAMDSHVLRLKPGQDPKVELLRFVQEKKLNAASISTAVGSLKKTVLRYSDQKVPTEIVGPREVLSLTGTLGATSGAHLHLSVSDEKGQVLGGHLLDGSVVYTTLEVVLLSFPELQFERVHDPASGYKELVIKGSAAK